MSLSDIHERPKTTHRYDSLSHHQFQDLFDRLIQITPDTSKEDLERLFTTYSWMTRLMGRTEAFDQLRLAEDEDFDAPFNRFYQDLKKPDSTFLTLLDGEIQKRRISANQAKKEVQLLEREKRGLTFLKFKKRFDPTEGVVFFDLFHKINHITVQNPIIARAVEWMNSSVKDQSISSFWATMGITSLVASYVLYKVAQFFFALTIATVCYTVGSIAWVLATLVRDCIGQGSHCLVDWLKRGEIKDLSKKNLAAISNTAPNRSKIWFKSPSFEKQVDLYQKKRELDEKVRTRALKKAFQGWKQEGIIETVTTKGYKRRILMDQE
jgi:hypothetical protein